MARKDNIILLFFYSNFGLKFEKISRGCKNKFGLEALIFYVCNPIKMQGELAHLVERLHGMQEVTGSIPVFSTTSEEPPPQRFLFVSINYLCINAENF